MCATDVSGFYGTQAPKVGKCLKEIKMPPESWGWSYPRAANGTVFDHETRTLFVDVYINMLLYATVFWKFERRAPWARNRDL